MPVAVQGIRKAFPGTLALDGVDLTVGAGEVHALLGANGSGKSTLVKTLTGVYQPDAGTIDVGDRQLRAIGSPTEAGELGIAVVHQESPLVDMLTVSECVALFRGYPTTGGRVRWKQLHCETAQLLERFDVRVDPRALAGLLSPAERALVTLAIALDRVSAGLQLLVLDEVTAALPEDQAQTYLERVGELARAGTPVLTVTHRLGELHGLATHVTVLRDGRVVHQDRAGAVDDEALVRLMVGGDPAAAAQAAPAGKAGDGAGEAGATDVPTATAAGVPTATAAGGARPAAGEGARLWTGRRGRGGERVLAVRALAGEVVRDASFELRAGEIVGVGGLAEAGVAELPQLLSGAARRTGGSIEVDGRPLPPGPDPRAAIDAGLALLPADRLRSGGVASLPVRENVVLPDAGRYWHRRRAERTALRHVIEDLDVRPPSADALFGALSGGNQQKILLAKWLLVGPSVLVLDDPTQGVDPGARATIFSLLRAAAAEGLAVLLFSTELEQLVSMCSRVLVLRDGTVAKQLSGDELTRETVSKWCYA
ncbi:sugar ABC transporter ATP-binding protein [Conexibacter arvalis]|uniref:ABC-type sugar transport system ATPase subunit n=1 Tax=Conexibacter arvalis TaxID=912552 RepID=A0A840II10_9ACTN|nr:sugar ABC transporter ATP-binding protein [Conexibacter arvalis]MBB4663851.1 ABC-type sugar transport system ATPase subunit [Conexibacter arvalis]